LKKNIGSPLALYPTPVTVIGALNGEKPTWTLVTPVGVIGRDHVLVSLAASHFMNGSIKANHKLFISIVNEFMLPQVDVSGSVSGATEDKSNLFEYEPGDNATPIIKTSLLTVECTVVNVYHTQGFESFICTISATYIEENYLAEDGKPNYSVLKPAFFKVPGYEYLRTGDIIGECLSFKD